MRACRMVSVSQYSIWPCMNGKLGIACTHLLHRYHHFISNPSFSSTDGLQRWIVGHGKILSELVCWHELAC